MEKGQKVRPKNPKVFEDYSGFYGTSLPDYFLFVTAKEEDSGTIWKVADPRMKPGEMWREQWFHSSHFEKV